MAPNKDEKNLVEKLRAFQRSNQANKRCADCPERGPTYVCLDFQIFICQSCGGIHREFGHKIKSISFSEWSPAEVAKLEEGGNEAARTKWLDRWHQDTFPEPDGTDLEAVREFIRLKYVEKKWYRPHAHPKAASAPKTEAASQPAATTSAVPQAAPAAQAPSLDLLSGGDAEPTTPAPAAMPAPTAPAVAAPVAPPPAANTAQVPDLLDGGGAQVTEEPWTADFGTPVKAPDSLAGLIDLEFSSPPKAAAPKPEEDLMAIDGSFAAPVASVEEPAAEPAPTDVEAEDTTSMGEKLRQAVLSGSQDDLKRLFEQCSKAPAKKHHAVDEKRLAAFSAFDDLLSPSHRQDAQAGPPAEASSRLMPPVVPTSPLQEQAAASQAVQSNGIASGSTSPGPQMFFIGDDSVGDTDLTAGSSAAAPSQPPPALASMSLTPELVQQLGSGALANSLTPHQLERMSPQELVQLQYMISSALQARAPPAQQKVPAGSSPAPWPAGAGGYRPPPPNRISSFDMAQPKEPDPAAPFGELLDMFQKKNTLGS